MSVPIEGWGSTDATDGYASEGEINIHQMVAASQARKNKKSGGFQAMGLSKPVYQGVLKKGYKLPTPIQRKTIPLLLAGKDVVAMARTGSGKTACFLIPLFEKLKMHSGKSGARALILSPTRELALQTLKFTKELGRFTGLRAAVVLGGDSLEGQFAAMHQNPDIIIATPGRFVHVCVEMNLKLDSVEYVVFDEADRLFEMGFAEQLNETTARLPESRQTLLFSATLPKLLVEFARAGLTDPVLVRLDVDSKLSENLQMAFFKISSDDKIALMMYILQNIIKPDEKVVIFVATRHHVEYLHLILDRASIANTYTYSSLDPAARKINVAKFQTKQVRCLIVTDVAARGIDIPHLDCVINFNFPDKPKLFIHRVGRVARAGRSGVAYSFVAPDEAPYLLDLHLFLSESIRFASMKTMHEAAEWEEETDRQYGRVPQSLIDSEREQIEHFHDTTNDLRNMRRVSANGYREYVKSRPAPSSESIRRMKEEMWDRELGFHPLLRISSDAAPDVEEKRTQMLDQLRTLRPKTTVFEISTSTKCRTVQGNMMDKRYHDETYITAFHKRQQERKALRETLEMEKLEGAVKVKHNMESSSETDVNAAFNCVISDLKPKKIKMKQKRSSSQEDGNEAKKTAEKKKRKLEDRDSQKQFYIPYSAGDRANEQGYAIGTSFEREVEGAVLDLTQDDNSALKQQLATVKWDRKKKKFKGPDSMQKRIKTESGVYIASSYKSDKYKKWIEKGRQTKWDKQSAGDSDNDEGAAGNKKFTAIPNKSFGKKHPLLRGQALPKGGAGKRELKTTEEIVKQRKKQLMEQERLKKKGGQDGASRGGSRGGGGVRGGRGGSRGRGGKGNCRGGGSAASRGGGRTGSGRGGSRGGTGNRRGSRGKRH